jgi:DNA polymerase/3'-5' exonuclease PolX
MNLLISINSMLDYKMNELIILWLQKIADDYNLDESKSSYQKAAIYKAIESIKEHDCEITSKKEAKKIKGIGDGIAKKIQIILATGEYSLKFVNKKQNTIQIESPINALKKVTGIGDAKAKKLVEKGILNVDMLKNAIEKNEIEVTDHIKIGTKYFYDFNQRIPRTEVNKFSKYFNKIFAKLNLSYEICGSYRRGKETCGDMDILVSSPKLNTDESIQESNIMAIIIKALNDDKILVEDGTLTPDAIKKFMGTCRLPHKDALARRLDIRIIKIDSYPSALMYFTGSKDFNLRLRNKAIKMEMMLNEYGLFLKNKDRVPISSEEDIFKVLKEEYLVPIKR